MISENTKRVSTYMNVAVVDAVEEAARSEQTSVSKLINKACVEYIERREDHAEKEI